MRRLLTLTVLFMFLATPAISEVIYDKSTGIGIEYIVMANDYGYYKIREITTHRDKQFIKDYYYGWDYQYSIRPFKDLERVKNDLECLENRAKRYNKNWKRMDLNIKEKEKPKENGLKLLIPIIKK
jgi:hypothetical protein